MKGVKSSQTEWNKNELTSNDIIISSNYRVFTVYKALRDLYKLSHLYIYFLL